MEALISCKSYSCGEVILKCHPLVFAVSVPQKGVLCDGCLASSHSLKKCSKCKQMFYCDRNCQRIDWTFHKLECNRSFRFKDGMTTIDRIVLRLDLMAQKDGSIESKLYEMPNNTNVYLNQIKNQSNVLQRSQEFRSRFVNSNNKSLIEFSKLYSMIEMKSFYLETIEDQLKIGLTNAMAFCVETSVLRHSCVANSAITNDGLNVELRAMTDIAVGEELFVNYIEPTFNRNVRQQLLSDVYYLNCNCFRCESDSHIDYERKDYLDNYLFEESIRVPNAMINTKKRLKLVEERIDLYKQCYNGFYNPKYTYFLITNLISLIVCDVGNKQTIQKYIIEVHNNLVITHGIDSKSYNAFLILIALFGYEVVNEV